MSTSKWATPEAIATAISADLNSLANGGKAISGAIDNLTDLYLYMSAELYLATFTPGAGSPMVHIWIIPSVDGANYEDGGAAVASDRPPDFSFPLKASTEMASRKTVTNIPIPPFSFKLLLLNNSGAALAAADNTLKYRRYNMQAVA